MFGGNEHRGPGFFNDSVENEGSLAQSTKEMSGLTRQRLRVTCRIEAKHTATFEVTHEGIDIRARSEEQLEMTAKLRGFESDVRSRWIFAQLLEQIILLAESELRVSAVHSGKESLMRVVRIF